MSVEVLLDMSAAGSELGWLTLPYENGVSIHTYFYESNCAKKKEQLEMSVCESELSLGTITRRSLHLRPLSGFGMRENPVRFGAAPHVCC